MLDELFINQRSGSVYVRGTGYRDRELPLNADARNTLEGYLADRKDTSHYVFTSQRSAKMSVRAIQHIVENILVGRGRSLRRSLEEM
ncbi:tyrosine-type recombinase/integrase [Paenibacillus sp. FSL R7-0026]|uniref:tyrosine-type recombinase/integrase n=1 Tax=Paenibacillus sp. FSL R7-0026 TaxID=2921668 RepID=UPI0040468C4B